HWIVPRGTFRRLTPGEDLATYSFNTGVAKHHFCPTCGVASFYVPRSDPDKIDVNARCLEGVDLAAIGIERFDGRNWEQAIAHERGTSRA
ncbi:MAG: GFA family protein, partial [Candidatus Binataceae bacterium]